jgi:peptidyl-prolyl cis-trans isomerase A (cyclophilin A)
MRGVLFLLLCLPWPRPPLGCQEAGDSLRVLIRTELGDIQVRLFPGKAPRTVSNFLRYVDEGLFEGGRFHRTVRPDNQPNDSIKIAVIQGDIDPSRRSGRHAPIGLETTEQTGVLHLDGAISMARAGPNTATSSFFICVGDQPELDFGGRRNPDGQGFAAFGVVVDGMDVVRAINQAAAGGQDLSPPIAILGVERLK